jgi:hypothetical protein
MLPNPKFSLMLIRLWQKISKLKLQIKTAVSYKRAPVTRTPEKQKSQTFL